MVDQPWGKEPWSIEEEGIDGNIISANGDLLLGGESCEGFIGEDDPNGQRAVACVNACAGMSNPKVEIPKLRRDHDDLFMAALDVVEGAKNRDGSLSKTTRATALMKLNRLLKSQ